LGIGLAQTFNRFQQGLAKFYVYNKFSIRKKTRIAGRTKESAGNAWLSITRFYISITASAIRQANLIIAAM